LSTALYYGAFQRSIETCDNVSVSEDEEKSNNNQHDVRTMVNDNKY